MYHRDQNKVPESASVRLGNDMASPKALDLGRVCVASLQARNHLTSNPQKALRHAASGKLRRKMSAMGRPCRNLSVSGMPNAVVCLQAKTERSSKTKMKL